MINSKQILKPRQVLVVDGQEVNRDALGMLSTSVYLLLQKNLKNLFRKKLK